MIGGMPAPLSCSATCAMQCAGATAQHPQLGCPGSAAVGRACLRHMLGAAGCPAALPLPHYLKLVWVVSTADQADLHNLLPRWAAAMRASGRPSGMQPPASAPAASAPDPGNRSRGCQRKARYKPTQVAGAAFHGDRSSHIPPAPPTAPLCSGRQACKLLPQPQHSPLWARPARLLSP